MASAGGRIHTVKLGHKTNNDASYSSDPEALLYDGIATLGMIGSLLLNDSLDLISPTLLISAVTDAVDDLAAGIEGLAFENPPKLIAILAGLFNDPPQSPEFTFDFTFRDIRSNPELTEFLVVNAVAAAINEPGDPPAYDFLKDDYQLVLNANTFDFDLLHA